MTLEIRDTLLKETKALPATATHAETDGIDLGAGDHHANVELLLSAPALTNAQLGSGHTMTYKIQTDDDSAFGSPTDLIPSCIVQTGAGAGAAADTYRFRMPSDGERYVRAMATASAADDASAAEMTLELLA